MITVCDETAAGHCPVFPGITKRFHWPFRDPEALAGTHGEKLEALREYRSQAHRPYAKEAFIKGLAVSRGVQIAQSYAEVFEVLRWII